MIVDHRIYTLRPGAVQPFLELFEREGLPLYLEYCGKLVGYYISESGTLNQVIHLWAYESVEDRERRRSSLYQDARWTAFLDAALPLVASQESRLLKPTRFSPGMPA
ncbi:NIPSNAP family protein [Sphingobium sp. DEHP117]|uniref:NIPSNAP family protein n=1 Tax=Sphingobium sp. DEHP117 TaxID=2993436 RepID=UPI0027D48980|nr:NIPSNAP family protein [Sphingobium sp. DEHP117]MDQ4420978.1 NIPSNAP family protein [Sphingobium sp. DEHP117]